jgi:hypothetical protein
MVAAHMKDMLHCFEFTHRHWLRIIPVIAASNYSMTRELESAVEDSKLGWFALRNDKPYIEHV